MLPPYIDAVDKTGRTGQARDDTEDAKVTTTPVSKGIVLGPDGKPCRTCTDVKSWSQMVKRQKGTSNTSTRPVDVQTSQKECPPGVEELGRASWTLLHTMAANYPEKPTVAQKDDTRQFISLFGKLYPCWVCASDFQTWIKSGNEPRVSNRDDFGRWMCEAHNAVNEKLGKKVFNCDLWQQRWKTGWSDGRCD